MTMGFKGFEYGCLAGVEFFELIQSVSDCSNGLLIEAARGLLTIAGDERDGVSLSEKAHGGLDTGRREREFVCNSRNMACRHRFFYLLCLDVINLNCGAS